MSNYHTPVLLSEAIAGLNIKKNGIYVDATFGGGGHSKAILDQLDAEGKLFAFDQDEDAAVNVIKEDKRFVFIPQNFKHCKRFLRLNGVKKVDGILADLGVSWKQIDTPERGFSFRFDGEVLDMRMNRNTENTAYNILNNYTATQLKSILTQYGELPATNRVVEAIIRERKIRPIKTVGHLKLLCRPFVKGKPNKFFAQLFQALRIEVNQELDVLKDFLLQSVDLLKPESRIIVITYHSIEDRIVKNFFKRGSFDGIIEKDEFGIAFFPLKEINKKVIVPSQKEILNNPKSRSAKMRIATLYSKKTSKE